MSVEKLVAHFSALEQGRRMKSRSSLDRSTLALWWSCSGKTVSIGSWMSRSARMTAASVTEHPGSVSALVASRPSGMTSTCWLFWQADFMRRPWFFLPKGEAEASRRSSQCVSTRSLVMQRDARFRCSQILAATESRKRSMTGLRTGLLRRSGSPGAGQSRNPVSVSVSAGATHEGF
jgi:hypothetical protein